MGTTVLQVRAAYDGKGPRGHEPPTPFEKDFRDFVGDRMLAGHRHEACYRPGYHERYHEIWKRYERLREKVQALVGKEPVEELEEASNELNSMDTEAAYLQGLRDGLELAKVLWGRNTQIGSNVPGMR